MKIYNASIPQAVDERMRLPPAIPTLPQEMLTRFPQGAQNFNDELERFWGSVKRVLVTSQQENSATINTANDVAKKTQVSFNAANATLTARIIHEEDVRADADGALATTIDGVVASYMSADAAIAASVTVEQTARVTADGALATSITSVIAAYQTADATIAASVTAESTARSTADGALATSISTVTAAYMTADSTIIASVTAESSARATADGNLSGKYTLLVAAGNVVTGMEITSSTGSGGTVSTITFQTDHLFVKTATGSAMTLLDISAYGIVFGTDVCSNNYAPGSAGWLITRAGNVEFNGGTFRGTIDMVAGGYHTYLDGTGIILGGGQIVMSAAVTASSIRAGAGAASISLSSISGTGQISWGSGYSIDYNANAYLGSLTIAGGTTLNGGLTLGGSGQNLMINDGVIMKVSPGGWGPYLWDGGNLIEFNFDGTNFNARANGGYVAVIG